MEAGDGSIVKNTYAFAKDPASTPSPLAHNILFYTPRVAGMHVHGVQTYMQVKHTYT